jgi:hypothetical protein
MKTSKSVLAVLACVVAGLMNPPDGFAARGGTSILHLMIRAEMSNTGIDADAAGSVNARLNRQGRANNQRLELSLSGLQPGTTYALFALVGDAASAEQVAEFDTDADGAALIRFVRKSRGRASPGGDPLPDELNPISDIRSLQVRDGSGEIILSADFTAPRKLQYLVKRAMTNDGVDADAAASLRMKATENFVQFRIRASGLEPLAGYSLAINGTVMAAFAADSNGELEINGLPGGSPDVLDIHELAILDASSASVLSTTLP